MEWALGLNRESNQLRPEILMSNGTVNLGQIEELIAVGVPNLSKRSRHLVEGNFSTWKVESADEYLAAFGIKIPQGIENHHEIFTFETDGEIVHLPALVLMRAFFKPVRQLLPRMFSPANIDAVAFVDFSHSPPAVIVDDPACASRISSLECGVSQDVAIKWLQSSKSARKTAQSVHVRGFNGRLGLDLPCGRFRMTFHGLSKQGHLFVTNAAMVTISVIAEDSISGHSEQFIFHAMGDAKRNPMASVKHLVIPEHSGEHAYVTDKEWSLIEPMLAPKQSRGPKVQHCRRSLLDGILWKISQQRPWREVPRSTWTVTDLTSAFRRWSTSGKLARVLEHLQSVRGL